MKHTHQTGSQRSGRQWTTIILLILIAFILSSAASPIVFEAMTKNQDSAPRPPALPTASKFQQIAPESGTECCVNWSLRSETGPAARHEHRMAYDAGSGKVTLFGGRKANGLLANDTWVWDAAQRNWIDVTPAGLKPSPRTAHAMVSVTSPAGSSLFLFGGYQTGIYTNDSWEWNGVTKTWRNVTPAGPSPSHRVNHAMAFDPDRGKVLLFGGQGTNNLRLNDMWEWDVTARTWTNITFSGPRPTPRKYSGMVYDEATGKIVLFGGSDATIRFGDTWEWDPAKKSWADVTPAGAKPSPRSELTMIYNSTCMKSVLYGGYTAGSNDERWEWDGLMKTWRLAPKGTNTPGRRSQYGMAYNPVTNGILLFGGSKELDTWEFACPCAEETTPLDSNGNVILPPGVDPNEIEYEDVEYDAGLVKDIYKDHDPNLDNWGGDECETSIGGITPPESDADLAKELADAGITGVTPEEIVKAHEEWETQIEEVAKQEQMKLATAGPVSTPYTPPTAPPRCKKKGCKYVFGGRDLVFVHGMKLNHLMDKMTGKPGATAEWKEPTVFPGSIENPEFYGNGYFKRVAEQTWKAHIERFLRNRGIQNRYLIVSYSCAERLERGAHAVLTQIGDAMRTGEGVVDPSGKNDRTNFGVPSYVVLSHSTGAPVTDVAMASAVKHPNLRGEFIARHAKAHISLAGAFSGSRFATAAVALSGYLAINTPDWVCPVARLCLMAWRMDTDIPECPIVFNTVKDSILIDLVPVVMKLKWGPYMDDTPVRTLTVVGAHPTYLGPLKRILHPGFDDGVLTVNSQVANPNITFLWPSGFTPERIGAVKVFDMGVWSPKGLKSPIRAMGYFLDQVVEPKFNPLRPDFTYVAGAATPYISPTGMVQPIRREYGLTSGFNPLRRYNNHYSIYQSTSDHFSAYTGPWDSPTNKDYRDTFSERNFEETRVITDPAIFDNIVTLYACDNQPLLDIAKVPPVREIRRGRKIGRRNRAKRWLWSRPYRLLDGWQDKEVMDYVYETVLTGGCQECPPKPDEDCNRNGNDDGCDISNGSSRDCNKNGIPDSCDGAAPVEMRGSLRPSTDATIGQEITLADKALTSDNCSPLTYRWSKDGVDLNDGGAFSGTWTNALTIRPISPAHRGVYVLTVTNACGCSATSSTTLSLRNTWGRAGLSDLSTGPGINPLLRGTDRITVSGGWSFTSPTQIGSTEQATFGQITVRYGRILAANEHLALEYTFDGIPLAVSSAPDFNVSLISTEHPLFRVEKTRRTIYGFGLSPVGFQLYFRPQDRLRPFVSTSGGFLFFKDAAPKFRSASFHPNANFANGSVFQGGLPRTNDEHFNYAFDFGGGIQVPTSQRQAFIFGYKYHHFSNMSRSIPNNPGFDAHIFYTGYSFSFSKP